MSTIYFRPGAEQPYHIMRCALMLVQKKIFTNQTNAYDYLNYLQNNNKLLFKHFMDEYYSKNKIVAGYLNNNTIKFYSSARGVYGEEAHMYW